MSGDITPYTDLITSEHQGQPDYFAVLTAILQPIADEIATLEAIGPSYDLDTAIGPRLDTLGQWIGASRDLLEPLQNVYFSFGIAGLGFGQGVWKGPFDPINGLVRLDDESYRRYLRATILANNWNGSIPQLYAILAEIFVPPTIVLLAQDGTIIPNQPDGSELLIQEPTTFLIQDNGDMSFFIAVVSLNISAVALAILTQGHLKIKPAGVRMRVIQPSVYPLLFGFGIESASIAGFGEGSWPITLATS